MKRLILSLVFILVFVGLSQASSEQEGLALLLRLDEEALGENIGVEVTIVNYSSESILIDGRKFSPIFKLTSKRVGEINIPQVVTQRTKPTRNDFVVFNPGQEVFFGTYRLDFVEDKPYLENLVLEGTLEFIFDGHEYGLKAFVGTIKSSPLSIRRVFRENGPFFKGVELYSWKDPNGNWTFVLLPGTNRTKSVEEIKNEPVNKFIGVDKLKNALVRSAIGEYIFWRCNMSGFECPASDIIDGIVRFGGEYGLNIGNP